MGRGQSTAFFAIVAAAHQKKMELYNNLRRTPSLSGCYFLTDSHGDEGEQNQFILHVTKAAKTGLAEHATPMAQLLFFWSRVAHIVEMNIKKQLAKGRPVIMVGFGGSVLAHASARVQSENERHALFATHMAIVQQCVYGMGIDPPNYIYLEADPHNLHDHKHLDQKCHAANVTYMNSFFRDYGNLPGQTVHVISADEPSDFIHAKALKLILQQVQQQPARMSA